LLRHEGAHVRTYDPAAMTAARDIVPDVYFARDAYDVAQGSDALVLVTEWNEFKELDMGRVRDAMQTPVLLDGRNVYDPDRMAEIGFTYLGMGRSSPLVGSNHAEPRSLSLREV
jgi:UDPglucose 6-dehydrogenase